VGDVICIADSLGSGFRAGTPIACQDHDLAGLIESCKESYVCVELEYADGAQAKHFTDWSTDVDVLEHNFESVPSMEITLAPFTGLPDEEETEIQLPLYLEFAQRIASGDPHSQIRVKIWEVYQLNNKQKHARLVYRGYGVRVFKNRRGKVDAVTLNCANVKNRLNVSLGMPASHHCHWIYGGQGCNATVIATFGVVSSIAGFGIVVANDFSGFTARLFHRGYIEIEGLRITIRDWLSGPAFELVKQPPLDWIGKTATVISGCDRTISTCRNTHSNELHFGGIGIAIPLREPTQEIP